MLSFRTITYASAYKTDYGTGMILPDFKSKRIITSCTKRYNNNMHRTASLAPAVRNLLDYCAQNMNENNEIQNSAILRMEFKEFMEQKCNLVYTDNTINKAFQDLKRHNILISFEKKRRIYVVNPLYFYNGSSETSRLTLLRKMYNATPNGKYSDSNLRSALGV